MKRTMAVCGVVVMAAACVDGGRKLEALDDSDQALSGSGTADAGTSGKTVFQTTWSGESADVMYFDGPDLTAQVFSSQSSTGPGMAFVDIAYYGPPSGQTWCDPLQPWPCWVLQTSYRGWQQLAPSALTFTPTGASLVTDMTVERCAYGELGPTCEVISIPLNIQWQRDGRFRDTFTGVRTHSDPWLTFREKGSYSSASALATGTIGPVILTNGYGVLNDSKGTSVTRTMTQGAL